MKSLKILILFTFVFLVEAHARAEGRAAANVEKLFLEGNFSKAAEESDRLIGLHEGRGDELYYLKGLSELKMNKTSEARSSFRSILDAYPGSKRLFDATLGIGDSHLLEGEIDKAVKVYGDMEERFSNNKNIAIVYFRLAACHKKLGSAGQSETYLAKARKMAPLSFELKEDYSGIKVKQDTALFQSSDIVKGDSPVRSDAEISVQVGCFKSKHNAEKVVKKLRAVGYDGYVEMPLSARDGLYRVKVGRLKSNGEAENLSNHLKKDGYSTKICGADSCE